MLGDPMLLMTKNKPERTGTKADKTLEGVDSSRIKKVVDLYDRRIFLVDGLLSEFRGRAIAVDRIDEVGGERKYMLASREWRNEKTVISVDGVRIGGGKTVVAAGVCGIESLEQALRAAHEVRELGADIYRAGTVKMRTTPYAWQGLPVEQSLRILREVGDKEGMAVMTEIVNLAHLPLLLKYHVDIIQVGTRHAQSFSLIEKIAQTGVPMLLKRGMGNTTEEFLGAIEYALLQGNGNVFPCERVIRIFTEKDIGVRLYDGAQLDLDARFPLDIKGMREVIAKTHLPMAGDPSHSAGVSHKVPEYSRRLLDAGADMLVVEVHPDPRKAKSDADQQLTFDEFGSLMKNVVRV